ncbi:MAG: hypothetical protein QHJ73_14425 [Armatimonadota bacterium]|nr:hypothetical protein [Armatimonadota bacterium]
MRRGTVGMLVGLAVVAWAAWGTTAQGAPEGRRLPTFGHFRGTVITAAGERVVIQKAEGGQMTLEPRWLGGGRGRDRRQIEYFGTLKQGDTVEGTYKLDEGTHYCVVGITRVGPDGKAVDSLPTVEGRVAGTVITANEERLVLHQREGGQMTIEARRVRREDQVRVDPEQAEFLRGLKPGDPVEVCWTLGDGNHFILAAMARPESPERAAGASQEDQVRALRAELEALRREVAALRELVNKSLEQRK